MASRKIIIGDVHGCYRELNEVLDKLSYNPKNDQLFFTGDLINRGPNSKECISLCQRYEARSVLGNHEYFLILSHDSAEYQRRVYQKMLKEFGKGLGELIDYLRTWPLWIEEPEFLLVHAGLHPTLHPSETSAEVLTNIRTWSETKSPSRPWYDLYTRDKLVVFGHWAKLGGLIRSNAIGLDLGCVYGGKLRALVFPHKKIIDVLAHQKYFIPTLAG